MTSSTAIAPHSITQYLFEYIQQQPWIDALTKRFLGKHSKSQQLRLEGIANPSIKALVIASLFQQLKAAGRSLILVCPDPTTLMRYQVDLETLLKQEAYERDVIHYPPDFFSPYDLALTPTLVLRQHFFFLERLKHSKEQPSLFLLPAKNLMLQFPSLEDRYRHGLSIEEDQELDPEAVMKHCLAMGYSQTGLILEPGDISRRGDILDIYAINGPALRLSFFGDTIESIREIDPESQRSTQTVQQFQVLPRSALVLTEERRPDLEQQLLDLLAEQSKATGGMALEGLAATIQNQIQALEQDFLPDGLEYYAPLLHKDYTSLGECLPDEAVLVIDDWDTLTNQIQGTADRLDNQYKESIDKGRLLNLGVHTHLTEVETVSSLQLSEKDQLFLDPFPSQDERQSAAIAYEKLDLESLERYQADMPKAVAAFQKFREQGFQVLVVTDYPQRVLDTCKEADVPAEYWSEDGTGLTHRKEAEAGDPMPGFEVIIAKSGLQDGFRLNDFKLAYFTDAELFGRHRLRKIIHQQGNKKKDDADTIQSLKELRPGDYVVHIKHGIGQFVELGQIRMDGQKREYLTIQYRGNDKLYVPVDQVNLLSRYRGAGEAKPQLSKIGGAEWKSVKKKVKKSLQNIAKELVQLYAARQKTEGFAFEGDSPWQVEMEQSFPYQETPDQWQAILDAKKDMESNKPMDRLICGDVGFGKTEVALRALFKSVLSGKQAAILVPTTILAQQHFNTVFERFQPYGVKVGLLSRFRSPKDQKEIVQKLKDGEVDVVIGTHRLLQKDIRFKDIGLLVIDEEHRFGVSHKEKIKQLRNHIDVLTMSATPIPRTLYMSLSGVREMSLINTPPVNRLPVQTFVGPMNPAQMRMAILQEVDRGGQVYYMHNRVGTIYGVAEQVKELIPEIRIAVAHGQMNPADLETAMLDFANRQYDLLLCTTIIESGVDIPTANTLIIDDADRYGLAQLYQIRGRVGRSDIQAYAYLYYSPEKTLTEDAKNRLRAIREFTALGSGYQIAMRDMEIRGVGNILGADQHGHMIQVGFDMYCEMLNSAIEAVQEGKPEAEDLEEPSIIDLNVTAFIPEKWVGDRDVKLTEYKRLAAIKAEAALDVIQAEWLDRFGPIPKETKQLVQLARLRIQATELDIPLVRADEEYLRISVPYSLQDWMKLQERLPVKIGKKLRWVAPVRSMETSTPTLLAKLQIMSGEDQVKFVVQLFKELKRLLKKK